MRDLDKIAEKIINEKKKNKEIMKNETDPRFFCISDITANMYCLHYHLALLEWEYIVKKCKENGIGVC